jgi:Resolvase, N terminal domain
MAGKGKRKIEAFGYMRTSSATNVGHDNDSETRRRVAIESHAKAAGYTIVDWFYDAAVKGADAVTARPGFVAMLDRIAGNGVRTIIVESPDRFARDLAVQLAGHDFLSVACRREAQGSQGRTVRVLAAPPSSTNGVESHALLIHLFPLLFLLLLRLLLLLLLQGLEENSVLNIPMRDCAQATILASNRARRSVDRLQPVSF